MAYPYNSYQNPYQQGYYNPYQQQPMMQQPMQQQQPIQQTQQPTNQPVLYAGRIWVNGKSEADFYPVAPNNAVDLWDRNGRTLYQKRADATGKPSMIICDIVERTQDASDNSLDADGKSIAYAKEEDLKTVVGAVKGLDGIIGAMKADIDALKSDMYGVAGKRKTARKQTEAAEDDE